MSVFDPPFDVEDPAAKLGRGRSGGGGPIPGGGGALGSFGSAGGGVFGGTDVLSGSGDSATAFSTAGDPTEILGSGNMFDWGKRRLAKKHPEYADQLTGGGGGVPPVKQELSELIREIMKLFAAGGSFSPGGSKALMDLTRSSALGDAEALRGRNQLIGRNLGVDPSTASSYALQSDLNTQGGVADIMSNASLGVQNRQEDFARNLLTTFLGGAFQPEEQKPGTDFGDLLEGIGTLLTGLTGL